MHQPRRLQDALQMCGHLCEQQLAMVVIHRYRRIEERGEGVGAKISGLGKIHNHMEVLIVGAKQMLFQLLRQTTNEIAFNRDD